MTVLVAVLQTRQGGRFYREVSSARDFQGLVTDVMTFGFFTQSPNNIESEDVGFFPGSSFHSIHLTTAERVGPLILETTLTFLWGDAYRQPTEQQYIDALMNMPEGEMQ